MKESTIVTIQTVAAADPETSPEQLKMILAACKSQAIRRKLITPKEACRILDCSRMTLCRYEASGKVRGYRQSCRKIRYDLAEIESIAFGHGA